MVLLQVNSVVMMASYLSLIKKAVPYVKVSISIIGNSTTTVQIACVSSCFIANSICHTSSNCSDTFPGLGTQTPGSCCGTAGSAYIGPSGVCQAC